MNLWIKPGVFVRTSKDHRHSVVDFAHERIRRSGQYGKGPAFFWRAGTPSVPNARDAHDRFVAKVDFERALSVAVSLPLVEPADGYNGALTDDEITIESALKDRLASRVDRR